MFLELSMSFPLPSGSCALIKEEQFGSSDKSSFDQEGPLSQKRLAHLYRCVLIKAGDNAEEKLWVFELKTDL